MRSHADAAARHTRAERSGLRRAIAAGRAASAAVRTIEALSCRILSVGALCAKAPQAACKSKNETVDTETRRSITLNMDSNVPVLAR